MKQTITLFFSFAFLCVQHSIAQCNFEEQNGIAIFEMESGSSPGNWNKESNVSGFTGNGYLVWRGGSFFTSPGNGTISYKVKINSPGTYRFVWRNRVGKGNLSTEHNDTWLKFPDANDFFAVRNGKTIYPKGSGKSPNPEGASSNGWFKVYVNSLNWSWRTVTSDFDAHDIYAKFNSAGVYTIQISARSDGHFIDRMVLYKESQYTENQATSLSRSQTNCGSGGGNDEPDCSDFNASLSALSSVSESDSAFNLSGGSPSGGTYSGQGVNNNRFNPGSVGPGTYTITYSVTQNGCTDSASRNITVTADNNNDDDNNDNSNNGSSEVVLVNAGTDTDISNIDNNDSFNKSNLPSSLGIVARGSNVRNVRFNLTGPINETRIEGSAPFSLFGDKGDDITGKNFPSGDYQLVANFNFNNGSSERIVLNFSITTSSGDGGGNDDNNDDDNDDTTGTTGVFLVNANNDTNISTISNGQVFNKANLPSQNLSILVSDDTARLVNFTLTGPINATKSEGSSPFSLFGDKGVDILGRSFPNGSYQLTVRIRKQNGSLEVVTLNFTMTSTSSARLPISSSIVSPNPVVGQSISVKIPEEVLGDIYYSLVSSSGVEIANGKVSERSELQNITTIKAFESENAGVYYLILQDKEGKTSIPIVKK